MKKYLIIIFLFTRLFAINGYLYQHDVSDCQDPCSQYYIEPEIDGGFGTTPIIFENPNINIDLYINRFVTVDLGQEVTCVECNAFEVLEINLSQDCEFPVACFVDPCMVEECQINTPVDCISNYCGGCHADFYDLEGNLVDCDSTIEECFDFTGIDFGVCTMVLGVGFVNGECNYISGCDWTIDEIDYSGSFFESIEECEYNCDSIVTDIDGNIYETVMIGSQLWMAENLKVTHYRNGDEISFPLTNDGWCCDENGDYDPLNETGQYGFIDYDPQNLEIYGNHYNWFAADDYRGVCPEGWHVPTDDEWTILITYLDEDANPEGIGAQSYIAGGKMKSTGTLEGEDGLWYAPNVGATNESGFTGLPAGDRIYGSGLFSVMHGYGDFWSSTGASGVQDENAYSRYLYHLNPHIYRGMYEKNYGFSIRCLANDYILGDINGDEILNVLDIVLMINMILSNEYSVVADVNEDGSVDVLDVVLMVNILVGGLPQSN